MSLRSHRVLLSELSADPAALPSEFRIFRAGANPSTKGTVIFDETAAKAVMLAYQTQGVDLMIDLEHQALDAPLRADSADARGWFKLEVRAGELWAVDVKWNADGARRLSEKTQRYTSPAFYTDEDDRVIELINVAICAMPATHQAAPLVAASRKTRVHLSAEVSASDISRAVDAALKKAHPNPTEQPGLWAWVSDIYPASVVYEYDGGLWRRPYEYSAGAAKLGAPIAVMRSYSPVAPTAQARACAPAKVKHTVGRSPQGQRLSKMNPELLKKIMAAIADGKDESGLLQEIVAAAASDGSAPPAEPGAEAMADTADAPPKPSEEFAALTAQVNALTKAQSAEVTALRATVKALTDERDQKDQAERILLVAELVKLGRDTPALAWAKNAAGEPDGTKPCARLQSEPIADLRSRVEVYRAAGPVETNANPAPIAAVTLSKVERDFCEKNKITPEQFQARKAKAARSVATAK